MKIISSTQLKELDKYTITHEPIASIDLMERAARALTAAITRRWDTSYQVVVFAGPGNNGGDALAVARMLSQRNYRVEVFNEELSDEELEVLDIKIPENETDGSFFKMLDDMIEEIFPEE